MLKQFEVRNFKNFKQPLVFNFTAGNYTFNESNVKEGCVRAAVIFGANASGKSNLGLALFDIVANLTDKQKGNIKAYTNLISEDPLVEFKYVFQFNDTEVIYHYFKLSHNIIAKEALYIDRELVLEYDHNMGEGSSTLADTSSLDLVLSDDNLGKLSFVKYVYNNTNFKTESKANLAFKELMEFVDKMLLFYSLDRNYYTGYTEGKESLTDLIVKNDKVQDLQLFLSRLGIHYKLVSRVVDGEAVIYVDFSNVRDDENKLADIFSVASTGTKALLLYYYWLIKAQDASFIFMDEFDAYYHFELAENIVNQTLSMFSNQVVFTTHNTNLMTNTLFRPDNLFILSSSGIHSLQGLTDKELREAHNLQKMYKAGKFNHE